MFRSLFALGAICAVLAATGTVGSATTIEDTWSSITVVPAMAKTLQAARASQTMVVYSLGGGASTADVLPSATDQITY